MRKIYIISFILGFILFISIKTMAQFTGGNASGYASATSVIQQLNPTLYNDIEITDISQPADNQTLHINTNYNLAFAIKNPGTYKVFPDDSIFFKVSLNSDFLIDSFLIISDTLQLNSSTNIFLPNILNFSDSINSAQLCVTLNGTSFASDSVASNNTFCNTVKIIDPTGISYIGQEQITMYYNSRNESIVLKNAPDLKAIYVYDIIGNEIPFILSTLNDSEHFIILPVKKPEIIFVKLISEKKFITKKLFVF